MADRGGVRASRRKTPTPQPTITARKIRTPRRHATRSASREVEELALPTKPARRSARQATVERLSEQEENPVRKTKKNARKEVVTGQFPLSEWTEVSMQY
jgi:hypothetical protein